MKEQKLLSKFNIKSVGHERTKTVFKIQHQYSRAFQNKIISHFKILFPYYFSVVQNTTLSRL